MRPREFLSANLVTEKKRRKKSANLSTGRSKVGIGEIGKKVKNMDVCVILCFIIDFFFFFFLRKFSVYFGNLLG